MRRFPNSCRLVAVAALSALHVGPADASCTFPYNPWGGAACEPGMSAADCGALYQDTLNNPLPGPKAIPVYGNFDDTPFDYPHPDDKTNVLQVHRSLSKLGLTKAEMERQIKQAIARWNQAGAGYPMLYYAGDATGDLSNDTLLDRDIGIVIESMSCIDLEPNSNAWPHQPFWTATDGQAYRGYVRMAPVFHGISGQPAGVERCEDLDPGLLPSASAQFPQADWDATISSELQETLVHEIGHTLGLQHSFQQPDMLTCGLGFVKNDGSAHMGVMAYLGADTLRPRRDDIEGLRAMHRGSVPSEWPILEWFAPGGFPSAETYDQGGMELETRVMPILANQVVNATGRGAMVYADSRDRVRVRTYTNGVQDALFGNEDIVWDVEEGKTFSPAAVAVRATYSMNEPQLFVAWNEDDVDRVSLHTYWALRDLDGVAWQVFGPEVWTPGIGGDRTAPVIGATHDPVHDDYVVVTLDSQHRPAFTVIDGTGAVTSSTAVLQRSATADAAPVNAAGAPVCLRTGVPDESLCLLPIITDDGEHTPGVLALKRDAFGFQYTREWRATGREAFGNVTLSWNEDNAEGMFAFTDEKGDVSWMDVTVGPWNMVLFADDPLDMYGNGRYHPAVLGGAPRDVVQDLTSRWPVCPYWDASSSGSSDAQLPGAPEVTQITRAACLPVCGDGYIDVHPWGGEQCEGTDVGGMTCADIGYDSGDLGCDAATCQFDSSACVAEPPPPPEYPDPDPGDCLEIDPDACSDFWDDGCYPDGPGSYGRNLGNSSALGSFAGLYCPDDEGTAVCGLQMQGGLATPTCMECPEPGSSNGDAAYGCPCETDADCMTEGVGVVSFDYDGAEVTLSCYGGGEQGWNGLGTCRPDIDEVLPLQSADPYNLEEFERTRWLCNDNCDALTDATGSPQSCHYKQKTNVDFSYAQCIDQLGCDGMPGGDCEMNGGDCSQVNTCDLQCTPDDLPGNADCLSLGYPSWYECADGWEGAGFCVPPGCQSPGPGWDTSACLQFVGAEVY